MAYRGDTWLTGETLGLQRSTGETLGLQGNTGETLGLQGITENEHTWLAGSHRGILGLMGLHCIQGRHYELTWRKIVNRGYSWLIGNAGEIFGTQRMYRKIHESFYASRESDYTGKRITFILIRTLLI